MGDRNRLKMTSGSKVSCNRQSCYVGDWQASAGNERTPFTECDWLTGWQMLLIHRSLQQLCFGRQAPIHFLFDFQCHNNLQVPQRPYLSSVSIKKKLPCRKMWHLQCASANLIFYCSHSLNIVNTSQITFFTVLKLGFNVSRCKNHDFTAKKQI